LDAASSAAAAEKEQGPDLELIETQIHHFLTHGEILNDQKGRDMVALIRQAEVRAAQERALAAAQARQVAAASVSVTVSVPSSSPADASMVTDESQSMEDDPPAALAHPPSPTVDVAPVQQDVHMASTPRHHAVAVQ
jgi:hypothetical protein